MQETALKINEHLDQRGKRLEDVSIGELREICRETYAVLSVKRSIAATATICVL